MRHFGEADACDTESAYPLPQHGPSIEVLLKLLIVVNVDWFFLSHRLPIALGAKNAGHEVHLATTLTEHREKLKAYGFIVHNLKIDRSSAGLLGLIGLCANFIRIFRTIRPDVVHLVTIKPVLIGGLAARFSAVGGVVYAVSGLGHVFIAQSFAGRIRRGLVGAWYRFILGAKNMRIIFRNPDDRSAIESIADLDPEKVVMIPGSGVDLSEYDYVVPPDGDMTILMAARLLATKGVNEFVEAAGIIKKSYPHVRFLLIGAPDLENPASILESDIEAWKQGSAVEILGHLSDIPALMQQSNIVVLPSYYGEGLPKVLIEAAACGRAVVATDMPGCRDAIEPGVTGILVPPGDTQALVSALLALIENPERCNEMGRAGRTRAESIFDVQAVVKTHLNIYQELREKI